MHPKRSKFNPEIEDKMYYSNVGAHLQDDRALQTSGLCHEFHQNSTIRLLYVTRATILYRHYSSHADLWFCIVTCVHLWCIQYRTSQTAPHSLTMPVRYQHATTTQQCEVRFSEQPCWICKFSVMGKCFLLLCTIILPKSSWSNNAMLMPS